MNDVPRDHDSGPEGTRTPDPLHAMQVRYQLRHRPNVERLPSLLQAQLRLGVTDLLLGCGQFDNRTVSPQTFQLIKETLFFVEDVNNDVAKVEQNPTAFRMAFFTQG